MWAFFFCSKEERKKISVLCLEGKCRLDIADQIKFISTRVNNLFVECNYLGN